MKDIYTGNSIKAFSQNARRKINIYRRAPYWRRADCIYIHIPKAAGTSINHALYNRTLGHYSIKEIRAAFPRLVETAFSFSITRNPYDRLVSAYLFARQGQTPEMGVFSPEQYAVPAFESFDTFVRDWLVRQDLQRLDHVFRPQSLYVCEGGKVAVKFLGQLESMDTAIARVEAELGRKIVVGQKNMARRDAPSRDYYTTELARIVFDLYREDFDLLGYSEKL